MKIAIVGSSGSGKSTLASQVARRLSIPRVELDAIYHLAGWTPNPRFLEVLAGELDRPGWVCDGNYGAAEHLCRGQADVIVVYDLPRYRVMSQVIRRTLTRAVTREALWNGNRESWSNLYRWDPERSIIRWTWTHYHPNRERYLAAQATGAWDHAHVVWLRSHADAAAWLEALTASH